MRSSPSVLLATSILITSSTTGRMVRPADPAPVAFNDNRISAGRLHGGVLSVAMVAAPGDWRPFGADQRGLTIPVFGEEGKPLQDPGPLLRVPLGTRVEVRLRNLTGRPLVVHGLSARRVAVMDSLVLAPGASGIARFIADAEGTYYYWGATHGEDFEHRELDDAHLNGALIVDPVGRRAPAPDRVFVIERNMADTFPDGSPDFFHDLFTFNGRPWPHTERLTYDLGDSVRWRIINATNDVHPLHLHGFFFRVDARGDLARDTIYWRAQQRYAVTEPLWDGTTMDMAWHPDRPGGWIFHCHLNPHVAENTGIGPDTEPLPARIHHLLAGYPMPPGANHAEMAMGGLILGIIVRPPRGWRPYAGTRRTLRLLVQSDSTAADTTRRFGYVLQDGDHAPAPDSVRVPGSAIVLHRGEPTRIWVVNRTPEMTQVHWHGLEIESFYDGVAGLSGMDSAIAPPIQPGDSFEVLVTPPRAGTFIYHTHINDIRQQTHGLYGPLIVLDSGQAWNPDSDRVYTIGNVPGHLAVNGGTTLAPATLKVGVPYRFRFINITITSPGIHLRMMRNGAPAQWTPLAKDGRALPPWQRTPVDARQPINIGETYDFGVQSADTGTMSLEVWRADGAILLTRQLLRFER